MFGTIFFTGATFHAEIFILYDRFPVFNRENIMRTNDDAHPATVAFFLVQLQGNDIAEINQSVHSSRNFETIHAAIPSPAIPI